MNDKANYQLIKKWRTPLSDGTIALHIRYSALFWEGPSEPGETGQYRRVICDDRLINGNWLNTAPSVSYYGKLPNE